MAQPENKRYKDILPDLLSLADQDILEWIKSSYHDFNINLYKQVGRYCEHQKDDKIAMQNIARVMALILEPISRNTVAWFLRVANKANRNEIAEKAWVLLNNRYAINYWDELIANSPDEQQYIELCKFINLSKTRLFKLFLEETSAQNLIYYLREYGPRLDSQAIVEHAIFTIPPSDAFCWELVKWAERFINKLANTPDEFAASGQLCLQTAMAYFENSENEYAIALTNEYLGTLAAQNKKLSIHDQEETALFRYELALQYFTAGRDPARHGNILMNMGILYGKKMMPDRSYNVEQCIRLLEESIIYQGEENAVLQLNLGVCYMERFVGDQQQSVQKAIDHLDKAIRLFKPGDFQQGMAYNNIGIAYKMIKPVSAETALNAVFSLKAALEIRNRTRFPYEWAETQFNLGGVYRLYPQNDFFTVEDSIECFEQALGVRTENDFPYDWAATLDEMAETFVTGYIYHKEFHLLEKAKKAYQQALQIRKMEELPYDCLHTASKLGALHYTLKEYPDAIKNLVTSQKAMQLLNNGAYNFVTKDKIIESYQYVFLFLIDAYLKTNQIEQAFECCLKIKSKLLSERIMYFSATSEVNREQYRSSPEWIEIEGLTSSIRQVQDSIAKAVKISKKDKTILNYIQESKEELGILYHQRKIKMDALSYKHPLQIPLFDQDLSTQQASNLCLDQDITIVEYYRNFGQWLAFVVDADSLNYFTLPNDASATIEKTSLWINELNKGFTKTIVNEDALLSKLYESFIKPVIPALQKKRRIMLSPYAEMHRLPLHAAKESTDTLMLFEQYEISTVPGMYTLRALTVKKQHIASGGGILIAAHPGPSERKLMYVHQEANTISQIHQGSLVLDENNATLPNIKQAIASNRFSIFHFSCHASFNSQLPLLSGLSLTDFISIDSIIDHFQFSNGPLVCLSACQSSISSIGWGDELTGLTQAFLLAGAKACIGSLWLVNDLTTSLLFQKFYLGYLNENLSPPIALRKAMQKLRSNENYTSIYFWGAFHISGII